jgi:outer membrane protein assembly factor BamD (BamD/ComL family)
VRDRVLCLLASAALAACSSSGLDVTPEPKLLEEARTSLAAGDLDRAVACSEALIERSSDSARKQEALYLAGEAHFADGEWVKAFEHYQTLLHDFPYSQYVPKIEEHVYAIGVEYLSRQPWLFFHDLFSGRERGAEVMREFASSFPNSSKADDALAAVANYRFSRREYEDAVVFYQRIARSYPDSEWADLAAYRRADCWRLDTRGGGYEERALLRAASEYRRYLAERPRGAFAKQAQEQALWVDEQVAIGEVKIARLYLLREQPTGAQIHFANVALAYPRTKAADEARQELEKRGWDLSLNSLDTLKLGAAETGDWVGDRLRGEKGYQ